MSWTFQRFLLVALVAFCSPAGAVLAQDLNPPPSPQVLPPPPPPPPPPPKIEVPKVPKMDAPLPPPKAAVPERRSSYGDRLVNCLEDGAGQGLGPNQRAEYSRGCAQR
jgi:hypothetical protein